MLVQKGYKVARVEQTETPQMMEERVKRSEVLKSSLKVTRLGGGWVRAVFLFVQASQIVALYLSPSNQITCFVVLFCNMEELS